MRKFFVLCSILLAVGACSSTEKKEMAEDQQQATTETTAEKTEAKAEDAANASMQASKATCTLDKDTRVIEVKKTESGGCELFYEKFGEAKSVASSGFGTQYCEEVKDRIESNLNKAGFTCK